MRAITDSVQPIRLMVVDNHNVVLKGIRCLIELYDDLDIVFEARSGEQAIELLEQYRDRVDVILMDVDMPSINGVMATGEIAKRWPGCRVILLTGFTKYVEAGFTAGAKGYVLKESEDEDIIDAIRRVHAGNTFVSQKLQGKLIDMIKKPFNQLTPREYDVLNDLGEGLTNTQIANKRHLSEHTVRDHVSSILKKLSVDNRTQAVAQAIERGFLR